MEIALELQQSTNNRGCGAEPEGASGDQQSWLVRSQLMALEHSFAIDGLRKLGTDRNSSDMNPIRGKTKTFHMNAVLLLSDKVPMECPRNPEGMKVIVRHHDTQLSFETPETDKEGKHSRRHEVRADDRVRFEIAHQIDERKGLGKVERQPALVRYPGIVARDIPPAEKLRQHRGESLV